MACLPSFSLIGTRPCARAAFLFCKGPSQCVGKMSKDDGSKKVAGDIGNTAETRKRREMEDETHLSMPRSVGSDGVTAASKEPPIVVFGLISDPQIARAPKSTEQQNVYKASRNTFLLCKSKKRCRDYQTSLDHLRRAVEVFALAKVDFCVAMGDLIDARAKSQPDGLQASRADLFDALRWPQDDPELQWYCPFGNNDVRTWTRAEWVRCVVRPSLNRGTVECTASRIYHTFSPRRGVRIVVLDAYDVCAVNNAMDLAGGASSHEAYRVALTFLDQMNPTRAWHNDKPPKNSSSSSSSSSDEDEVEEPNHRSRERVLRKRYVHHGLHRFQPYNGMLGGEQLTWLRRVLADADTANERVWVLSHLPVFSPCCRPDALLWNAESVAYELRRVRCVQAFIAGHDHFGGYARDAYGIHHLIPPAPLEAHVDDKPFGMIEIYSNHWRLVWYGNPPPPSTVPDPGDPWPGFDPQSGHIVELAFR